MLRLGAWLTAWVLLFGIARSGARYFYCPMMDATMEDACCPSTRGEAERDDVPAFEQPECCKGKRLGALPSAAASASVDVADAALAHVLPSIDHVKLAPPPRVDVHLAHEARAGPHSPTRRRSSLMIWNC